MLGTAAVSSTDKVHAAHARNGSILVAPPEDAGLLRLGDYELLEEIARVTGGKVLPVDRWEDVIHSLTELPAPAPCPGDMNGDRAVDDGDFVIFVAAYNELLCP